MKSIGRYSMWFVILVVLAWIVPRLFVVTIAPDEIGVRQSNISGISPNDLGPGWALRILAVHKIHKLPRRFEFLDYTSDDSGIQQPLQIRTKDNNIVLLDVSVPYRVKQGEGYLLVRAGNHIEDGNGRYRFQRLAEETTVSVLRERLADLTSRDFYATEARLEVAGQTLELLNESLASLHLEAEKVLIRAVSFRPEYEQQLQQIQLNEQNKLLDGARERVAVDQQKLDAYVQGTNALASAREQDWIKRQAELDRAYQVGFLQTEESTPGAVRAQLVALQDEAKAEIAKKAAEALGLEAGSEVPDHYLLGIKTIQAETLEYKKRVGQEAEGIAARLEAEGAALLAQVQGEYETKLNILFDSPAGKAYVAYKSAAHVKFDQTLTFQSRDGIPSVLRLRDFATKFMGK